jgi:hypothetical protein
MRALAAPNEDPAVLPTPEQIMPAYLYLIGGDSRGVSGLSINARDALNEAVA